MGFNTYGKSTKSYGGSLPVWRRVDAMEMGGGTLDISASAIGVVATAGSMCYLDAAGGTLKIIASTDTANLTKVNGLLYNDIVKEEGDTFATGAVVYAGEIYGSRVDVPDSVKAQLPQIHFVIEK